MAPSEIQNGGAEKAIAFKAFKPQLFVEAPKANDAVQFYKAAFGAEEVDRVLHPKRKAEQETPAILSTELSLSGFSFLVSDFSKDSANDGKVAETRVMLFLETEDIDAAVSKAVSAGAITEDEIADGDGAYSGSRVAKLKDPYGFVWVIGTPAKKTADAEA